MPNQAAKALLEESNRRVALAIEHLHAARDFIKKAQAKDDSLKQDGPADTLDAVTQTYADVEIFQLIPAMGSVENVANPPL